jgi:hypothetical protein
MGASPRAVDWDEDGDFDLVSGEYSGYVTLFRNIGTATNPSLTNAGRIRANGFDIDVGNLSVPDINDWDEDGRKDLIVGCDAGNIFVYLNTGTNAAPAFNSSFKITANGTIIKHIKNCPRIVDLNEDGLKDLVLAWIDGSCLYWPNHGTNAAPVFKEKYELTDYTDVLDPDPSAYNWCHFGVCDWTEDGHPDLLYTRWESDIGVHLHGTHQLECAIEPVSPTIIIPPEGGTIDYKISITNNSAEDAILDVWIDFLLPDGTPSGPVRTVGTQIKLLAGTTNNYAFTDSVPQNFQPSNNYTLAVFMGSMGNGYFVSDGFTFIKADHLAADALTVPEAGGTVNFYLFGGSGNALRDYILMGSVSGMVPGTSLPGGLATLPLNWDDFTGNVISLANTPIFANFMGTLDAAGEASAALVLPPVSGVAGITMYYAYALNAPWDFASNPVSIEIVQ